MKNTQQKLTLSQEALRILTQEHLKSAPKFGETHHPVCPTCTPNSFLGTRQ